jgi:ABC-type multidrug transport system fused ATPase/permease subunit
MGLKTEKTQKLRKEKRYYTEFGKIKYFNILRDFFSILILVPVGFLLLEMFFFIRQFGFSFVDYLSIQNLFILTKNIFNHFSDLKNHGLLEAVTYYYILSVGVFFVFYLLYLVWQIKKANKLAKLSNLGLENYDVKKKSNGLLFILKRGEELDLKKFKDENLENIRQVFNFGDDELIVERWKNKGVLVKRVKLQVGEFNVKFLKKGKIFFGKGLKSGNIYIKIPEITHFLVVGQSGAGKSVFQNLLINQFVYNLKNGIEELYLVDLKGGVEFLQYNRFKNVKVVTNVNLFVYLKRSFKILKEKSESISRD